MARSNHFRNLREARERLSAIGLLISFEYYVRCIGDAVWLDDLECAIITWNIPKIGQIVLHQTFFWVKLKEILIRRNRFQNCLNFFKLWFYWLSLLTAKNMYNAYIRVFFFFCTAFVAWKNDGVFYSKLFGNIRRDFVTILNACQRSSELFLASWKARDSFHSAIAVQLLIEHIWIMHKKYIRINEHHYDHKDHKNAKTKR